MKSLSVLFILAISACHPFTEVGRITAPSNSPNAGNVLVFHNTVGHCKEIGEKYKVNALEAVLTTKNVTFQGCYIEREGSYLIQWDDGDRDVIPVSSLDGAKKAPVSQGPGRHSTQDNSHV